MLHRYGHGGSLDAGAGISGTPVRNQDFSSILGDASIDINLTKGTADQAIILNDASSQPFSWNPLTVYTIAQAALGLVGMSVLLWLGSKALDASNQNKADAEQLDEQNNNQDVLQNPQDYESDDSAE